MTQEASSDYSPAPTTPCRLCGGQARHVFNLRIMRRLDVGYYRCEQCESLQTEPPHWVQDAYADDRRFTDTDAASRASRTQTTAFFVARLLGIRAEDPVLDWGGGDGLTTRMLRDAGLNAFLFDAYANNLYALGFEGKPGDQYKMIVSIEVWEHFSEPAQEIEQVFAHRPQVVYITTSRYQDQGPQWEYLVPYSGRHLFLYSEKAMRRIAEQYKYHLVLGPNSAVFSLSPIPGWKQWFIRQLLPRGRRQRLFNALFELMNGRSRAPADHRHMMREMGDLS